VAIPDFPASIVPRGTPLAITLEGSFPTRTGLDVTLTTKRHG
jgi:hypothetical protein